LNTLTGKKCEVSSNIWAVCVTKLQIVQSESQTLVLFATAQLRLLFNGNESLFSVIRYKIGVGICGPDPLVIYQ